jgi:hypothetical protein
MPTRRGFLQFLSGLAAASAARIALPTELLDDGHRALVEDNIVQVTHSCQASITDSRWLHRWQVTIDASATYHVDASLDTPRPTARQVQPCFQVLADSIGASHPLLRLRFPEAA